MPSHKNQHFVPRCHLKPFTDGARGAAINVFNITSDRGIRNAPVKSQCSKHYFYGRDLEVEKILQEIEGRYSRFIQDITGTGYKLKPSDSLLAKRFMFLQHSRTEMAMRRRAQSFADMQDAVFS